MKTSFCQISLHHVANAPDVGTAAVISPVDKIGYEGQDVHIPTGSDGMGPVSRPLWKELVGIQMGTIPSEWSVPVTE